MISAWHRVESSNVEAIGFDEDTKEILVLFKNNGGLYAYDPATTIYEAFVLAASKGTFVNEVLKKGGVAVRKIDQPAPPTKIQELEQKIQEEGGVA